MIGLLTKGISKVFGSKSERDIKLVMPYVEKIIEIYPALRDISDEDLRAKTGELRDRISDKLAEIDNNIDTAKNTAQKQKISNMKKSLILVFLLKLP